MADNLSKKGPGDSSKINIHEDYELEYWTKALNCSKEELKQAVKQVGVSVEKVREHLKK